jgi:type I restriction enzyme R subunit
MSQNKIPAHIKLDERKHVEKPLLAQFDIPGWDMITLMQDLLTGKKRVPAC